MQTLLWLHYIIDQISYKGFYVTLPSNASLDVFESNMIFSYYVDLAQHIDLKGPWQIALIKISYLHTWFNIPLESAYFEWRKKPNPNPNNPNMEGEVRHQKLRGGYYTNLNQGRAGSLS